MNTPTIHPTVQGPTDLVLILVSGIENELASTGPDADRLASMRAALKATALLCHVPNDDMSRWG